MIVMCSITNSSALTTVQPVNANSERAHLAASTRTVMIDLHEIMVLLPTSLSSCGTYVMLTRL